MKSVIIIGAGIGGLATAALLAKAGYKVTLYEQAAGPGGRAGKLQQDGFTFDAGPSWYLMPEVFEQFFELLGEDIHKHLQLQRLDPAYKVFFETKPPVTIHADLARDAETFESIEPGAGSRLKDYLQASETTYQAAIENFLYTNFAPKRKLLSTQVLKLLPRLARVALQPIDRYVAGYFQDPRLRQIMEYPMVFLGTSPFEAPAIYSLMSHMDFTQGVHYPAGGLYTIIEALYAIGRKLGVEYRFNSPVEHIETKGGVARGVRLQGRAVVHADIVVSAADLHFTETSLLDERDQTYSENYWQKKQAGPSALLLYLGVRGKLPQLEHHNLLFTDDWRANFEAIFKDKRWPEPASVYICKPSQTDASVAPAGHENLFVLVPAPAKLGVPHEELERLADGYLQQITTMAGIPDLAERIVTRDMVGPDDFARDLHAWQGSALGLSHRLDQSALFRPANKSKKVQNLFYVGGNTVPGIGLPMCLIGAQLVYKRLTGDTGSAALPSLADGGHGGSA